MSNYIYAGLFKGFIIYLLANGICTQQRMEQNATIADSSTVHILDSKRQQRLLITGPRGKTVPPRPHCWTPSLGYAMRLIQQTPFVRR